jgi:hypothetical protein
MKGRLAGGFIGMKGARRSIPFNAHLEKSLQVDFMKGVVDKVWENKTDDGKPYFVLKIGGEKYSVWDKKYMDGIEEGSMVEYESAQSGKFKKIIDMKKIDLEPGVDRPERKPRDRNGQEI